MSKKIAVIVPCYNEEKRLRQDVFIAFVNDYPGIDLWLVNDGSTDNTLSVLEGMQSACPGNMKVFALPKNVGKAEAIRQGILKSGASGNYFYTGFIDADLSAPLAEIPHLYSHLEAMPEMLMASGCRVKIVGKTIERSAFRHYVSRMFVTYYSMLLKLPNYDTQCGLKLFNMNFALKLFEKPFVSRWMFDVELFLRAKFELGAMLYSKRIHEIPLNEWREVGGSKLKWTDFLKAPLEILKIRKHYKEAIAKK